MPILQIYVGTRTMTALEAVSKRLGRSVEDLAEAAVSEAAIASERGPPCPKQTEPDHG